MALAVATAPAASSWGASRYFLYTAFDSPTESDFKDMLLTNKLPFAWHSTRPTSRTMYGAILEAARYLTQQDHAFKRVHDNERAGGEHLLLEITCVRTLHPPTVWLGSDVMIGGATF
jgi:hypothetical protein